MKFLSITPQKEPFRFVAMRRAHAVISNEEAQLWKIVDCKRLVENGYGEEIDGLKAISNALGFYSVAGSLPEAIKDLAHAILDIHVAWMDNRKICPVVAYRIPAKWVPDILVHLRAVGELAQPPSGRWEAPPALVIIVDPKLAQLPSDNDSSWFDYADPDHWIHVSGPELPSRVSSFLQGVDSFAERIEEIRVKDMDVVASWPSFDPAYDSWVVESQPWHCLWGIAANSNLAVQAHRLRLHVLHGSKIETLMKGPMAGSATGLRVLASHLIPAHRRRVHNLVKNLNLPQLLECLTVNRPEFLDFCRTAEITDLMDVEITAFLPLLSEEAFLDVGILYQPDLDPKKDDAHCITALQLACSLEMLYRQRIARAHGLLRPVRLGAELRDRCAAYIAGAFLKLLHTRIASKSCPLASRQYLLEGVRYDAAEVSTWKKVMALNNDYPTFRSMLTEKIDSAGGAILASLLADKNIKTRM